MTEHDEALAGAIAPAEALEILNRISGSLMSSYRELATRAERVEQELEVKVAELDGLSRSLEAILDALPTGVVVRDGDGCIARVNRSTGRILGEDPLELLQHDGALLDGADGATQTWTRPDGSIRTVVCRSADVVGSDGQPSGSVEILDDQTELARLTERLHRVDKLAALGNVAAGIAHEIRNPLNAVKGFAGLLKAEVEASEKQRRWATCIVDGVGEIERIVASMLSFARPESLEPSTIDARALVAESRSLALGGGASESLEVDEHVEPIQFVGDHIKLRQAVRNLLANARDVQSGTGRIRVELSRRDRELVIAVSDGGPGFPPDARERAFDPFFTTRPEGTGLGLSLVNTIAELHGGRACIDEGPCDLGGARVSLVFPFQSPQERATVSTH